MEETPGLGHAFQVFLIAKYKRIYAIYKSMVTIKLLYSSLG